MYSRGILRLMCVRARVRLLAVNATPKGSSRAPIRINPFKTITACVIRILSLLLARGVFLKQ